MNTVLQLLSCFMAAGAFSFLLHQPRGTIIASSLCATAGYGLFLLLEQSTLGYFAASLLIGTSCEICARCMKRAATLFVSSALIPLVPGLGLYRTVRHLTQGTYASAISIGTQTLLGLCAIALAITLTTTVFSIIHRYLKTRKETSNG